MDETQFLALPDDQRKEVQRQLKAQNLYAGPIDGKSGTGMRTALGAAKAARDAQAGSQVRGQELELEKLKLQEQAKVREAETAQQQQAQQQAQAREQAADPMMDTFLPFAAGAAGGGVYGELANRGLNAYEAGNARALNEIAKELGPTNRLTSSQLNRSRAAGAAKAAERFAPSGQLSKALAGVGRASSYGIPAGVVYNEYTNYQGRADDPKLTEKERKSNQQIANGLLGVTTGIGVEGGRRFFFPSRPQGIGTAQMRIDTARDFASRMDASDAKPKGALAKALEAEASPAAPKPASPAIAAPEASTPPTERTPRRYSKSLVTAAREAGATGPLNKVSAAEYLAANVTDANRGAVAKALGVNNGPNLGNRLATAVKDMASKRGVTSVLAPVAAGAVAYDAMRSPSMADDGTMSEPASVGESAAVGAGAAGATAAGIKGGSKLAAALAPTMLGRVAARAFPPAAAALGAYDVARGVNSLAHLSPPQNPAEYSTMGAFMLQESPSDEQQIAMDSAAQAQRMPLPTASGLQIPENMPAPREDGGDPFAGQQEAAAQGFQPNIQARLDRMIRLGAPPEAISQFLNSAVR